MAYPRLFRIFYSTFFTLLNIVTLGLLLITPADAINQALSNNQIYNVFVIAGGYLLTLILAILIYASRLYTNRTVVAGIPKTWIPVEKGDVRKSVRKMIMESLSRSAVISWNARPRVLDHTTRSRQGTQVQVANVTSFQTTGTTIKHPKLLHRKRAATEKDEASVSVPPHPPVWGEIAHEGWSSPSSPDLPNLQFITVILELPHLIEARAVSLAPSDTASKRNPPMPDLRAVELLQRPAAMSLRDYIGHLTTLGILPASSIPTAQFLASYEQARFSSRPRSEPEFRDLMKLFADILRAMSPLNPAILDSMSDLESDIDADASSTTTSEEAEPSDPPRSRSHSRSASPLHPASSRSGSEGTIRTAPSRRRAPVPIRSATFPAPRTPKSRKKRDRDQNRDWEQHQGRAMGRSPSASLDSFAQTKRPYDVSLASSHSSLMRTVSGASGGSVIKLSRSDDMGAGGLPYVIRVEK